MKKYFFFALAAAFTFAVACNPDPEVTKEEEQKPEEQKPEEQKPEDQTPETTTTTVCLNEVCGVSGYKSVELYNSTDAEVSIEGYTLIKNEAEAATWTGTADDKIPAKGFYVIKAKKETTEIDAVANATAKDSFSPGQCLKLELKNPDGNVVSTFVRGGSDVGTGWGQTLEPVTCSFALATDGGTEWKLKDITIGASNNSAKDYGEIPVVIQ